jgi:myo-inositol-1(or 4)-monophosphatase
VKGLGEILPEAGFIAEEGTGAHEQEEWKWIIDPIDGTTNFIHQLPPYSISIALMHHDEIVLGLIYEITSGECFYAWKGSNAWLDGQKITVTPVCELEKSFIATGFPYQNYERIDAYMALLKYLMQHTPGVRRLGSAAIDLAYVACGRFEAFYEYNLKPWDVAAGAFLVKQAGGTVSDFNGGEGYLFGKEIIATNGSIHQSFMDTVNQFMG